MRRKVRAEGASATAPLGAFSACSVSPGSVEGPEALERARATWTTTPRPAPAAAVLRDTGAWSLDGPPRRFDAEEWWYRARFARGAHGSGVHEVALCLDGLATLADVWLNGELVLTSDNMFVSHEIRVDPRLREENDLHIRFRALDAALAARRLRPRWRAPMVEHPQLRWIRTTLLGRTPGWSPPAAVVGPWREVRLERRSGFSIEELQVSPSLAGATGRLDLSCVVRGLGGAGSEPGSRVPHVSRVEAVLERAGASHGATLAPAPGGRFAGRIEIPRVERWWPHTHGDPALYRLRLIIEGRSRETVDLGAVGFREVVRVGDFDLAVNGVPIFCRGACWTPLDPVTLVSERPAYEAALLQARDCGMNMLRVAGTMFYESDDFYDLADELGILVWQDFMFANMDYPDEDPAFVASVETEARQILCRLQGRPSIAVLCGSSEGEQQAAMWGAPRERWSPRLFHELLPRLCAESLPGVPYWPSSAHGGAFPHDATAGTSSYYGVGAYLRPLDDARRSEVRFATECLAFANVPAEAHLPGGSGSKVHHPAWKSRTPRDLGAGWDFDDVRDHYLADLFGLDPLHLRYADHDRYLALGRVVTGEVMASALGEWRRERSVCKGALVWFLRDLWTSAGWGIIDAGGRPKAAYSYLRRALTPIFLHLTDEGGSGLFAHVVNERAAPLTAELEVALYKGETLVTSGRQAVSVPARSAIETSAARLFDGFLDLTFAYRFGPPSHDLVVGTLRAEAGEIGRAFYFPLGLPSSKRPEIGLTATASARADGDFDLTLCTRAFAQSVAIEAPGFAPEDDFFHIAPGGTRVVRLRRTHGDGAGAALRGQVQPLSSEVGSKITLAPTP